MKQSVDWAISRMRRILEIWDGKLGDAEKRFILRRIRDEEPQLYCEIYAEKYRTVA